MEWLRVESLGNRIHGQVSPHSSKLLDSESVSRLHTAWLKLTSWLS